MDLVDATDKTTDVAKCLSSVRVTVAGNCDIAVSAPSAGGSFVTALWGSATQPTYTQLMECPSTSSLLTGANGGASADNNFLDAVQIALNQHIYGASGKSSGLTGIAAADGVVTFGTTAYIYAVKASTVSVTGVVAANGAGLDAPLIAASVGDACTAGRFGAIVGDIKLCPLCPAGTTGDGSGCTACASGTTSGTVGVTICATTCAAGTYSGDGQSDCLPCPAGTYSSATGQSQCLECPNDSYSWLPGSTSCLRCMNGIPKCVVGPSGAGCSNPANEASSPGYQILSTFTQLTSCTNLNTYLPAAYQAKAAATCTSWSDATPANRVLQLALTVAGDCSITIRPTTDTACAEQGAVGYNDLTMRAYYATTNTVRSLMPSGSTKSFLLGMDQSGCTTTGTAPNEVTTCTSVAVTFWAATTDSTAVTTLPAGCTSTASTIGGQVALLPSPAATSCPAGSYIPSGELYCAAW